MLTQDDIDHIRSHVETVQASNPSVGACRRLSHTVAVWLRDTFEDVSDVSVTREQGYFDGEAGVAEHFYLRFTLADDTELIIDPTVDQFTYDRWVQEEADTHIPDNEIPDIGVIDDSMDVFSRYQ